MHIYYIAGIPYSDELYHYGILGQKWGVRRFQNPDGTLTALGKIHYGVEKTGEAISKGAKIVGKGVKNLSKHKLDKFKSNHTWMLSEEELAERTARLDRENRYRDALAKNKQPITRGKKVIGDILETGAKTLGAKAFGALGEKIFGKKEKAVRDLEEVLLDPKATASEIKEARDRFNAHTALKLRQEKERADQAYYDPNNLPDIRTLNKQQLDAYTAWTESYKKAYGSQEGNSNTANVTTGDVTSAFVEYDRYQNWLQERDKFNK